MAAPPEEDHTKSNASFAGSPAAPGNAEPSGHDAAEPLADGVTASQELVTPLANLSGRRLVHFQVQDRLGAGAMSSVYRAVDERTGDAVALKILLPGADSVAHSRFQQEARTASQLDHRHIIRTFEVGETDAEGMAFISMELIDGESLSELLERNRQLSIFDTCLILERIARALDYAHRQGIVHRDVKPSNILLRRVSPEMPGAVQLSVLERPVLPILSDFGIARAMDAPELTSLGRTVGTPSYMAPEQCSGSHEIDGHADLYSLGTVFYRALVGRPPYVGTTTQVLYAHVYNPLTIPDEVLVNLPMPVIDILRRSLMKEPPQRYATAAAMAIDMARITGSAPGPPVEGAVDMDELTATMTALPATERTTSSSTILVPSHTASTRAPFQRHANATASVGQPSASTSQRSGSRREMRRVSMGIGLALIVLLAILTIAVARGLNPTAERPGGQAAATPPPNLVDGTPIDGGDSIAAAVTTQPDGDKDQVDADSNSDAIEPAPAQTPFFDAESIWTDAEFFYIDRDWVGTLDQLILMLRTDTAFNQQLADYDGPQTELIDELFFQNPDNPFWHDHADLFDSDKIEAMLFDSLVGLAARANARNQSSTALDLFTEALLLRPDAEEVVALAAATKAVTNANLGEVPLARDMLHSAYVDYAASVAEDGHYCWAAEHLTTAVNLKPSLDQGLNAKLSRYQDRCAATIATETEQAGLAQLSGTILFSTRINGRDQINGLPVSPDAIPALILENGTHPSLSPNGDKMAFFSTSRDGRGLSALNVNPSNLTGGIDPNPRGQRLTNFGEDGFDGPATWSTSGDQIAFSSRREGDRQSRIYVGWAGDSDSSATIGFGIDPAWHPSHDLIVHNGRDRTGNEPGLWLRRSDGNQDERLTSIGNDVRPTWTADGSQIIFASDGRDGNWEIYRLDMGKRTVTRVTDHPRRDVAPAVSPDGSHIAFLSDRDGDWAIWIVGTEGGGDPTRLAPIAGELPNWREHSLQWVR